MASPFYRIELKVECIIYLPILQAPRVARSLETYLKHIGAQSESTINSFRSAHKSFAGLEELIGSDPGEDEVYDALQRWINGMDLHPSTVRTYFSRIRQYLYYRGIRLQDLDVRQNLRLPAAYVEEMHPLTREEFQLILEGCDHRRRILYLAQSSSGMRIGELVRLRRRHLDTSTERITVRIPASLTKNRRGRTAFFSREVSRLLLPRLEGVPDSDLVFATSGDPARARLTEVMYLGRLVVRLGLGQRHGTSRNRKITTHSFRAYFITKVSRHDPDLAKMLAGQQGHLLQYDRLTDEEKLERYLEFEPDLIIRDQPRCIEEIRRLKLRIRLYSLTEKVNDVLLDRTRRQQARIRELRDALDRKERSGDGAQ